MRLNWRGVGDSVDEICRRCLRWRWIQGPCSMLSCVMHASWWIVWIVVLLFMLLFQMMPWWWWWCFQFTFLLDNIYYYLRRSYHILNSPNNEHIHAHNNNRIDIFLPLDIIIKLRYHLTYRKYGKYTYSYNISKDMTSLWLVLALYAFMTLP